MFFSTVLPSTGVDVAGTINAMILELGAVVAVIAGAYFAFRLIKFALNWVGWIDSHGVDGAIADISDERYREGVRWRGEDDERSEEAFTESQYLQGGLKSKAYYRRYYRRFYT